jgi:hypothetical protein
VLYFYWNWKELFFFLTLISENVALIHSKYLGTIFTAPCVNISFWGTRGDAMVKEYLSEKYRHAGPR